MNHEDYCSYELSKKLKEKGFNWECPAVWHYDGQEWNFISDYGATFQHPEDIPHWNTSNVWGAHIYSAPTLYQAQKWLREKNHIHVSAEINCLHKWFAKAISLESNDDLIWDGLMFPTYEQALSASITKALELI